MAIVTNTSCNTKRLLSMPKGFTHSSTFLDKEWKGAHEFVNDNQIWTDGEHVYYSSSNVHRVLDRATRTWKRKVWKGLKDFTGSCVWATDENIYCSNNAKHYVLNRETDTWEPKTWNGLPEDLDFDGRYVWTDGENTYYSDVVRVSSGNSYYERGVHYILDEDTSTWTSINLGIDVLGSYVWSDGENVYAPPYRGAPDVYYIFNKYSKKFTTRYSWSFEGDALFSYLDSRFIWTDGVNTYYSYYDMQLVFDKQNKTWSPKTWEHPIMRGYYVWTDGVDTYCNDPTEMGGTYKLSKETGDWEPQPFWNGCFALTVEDIWTDGENIYWTKGISSLVLDKSTGTWSAKAWNGAPDDSNFSGEDIWTDGENIYNSRWDCQYVLNRETDTWEPKTWNGLTSFFGSNVWTDGTVIYCWCDNVTYVLNKVTSTWEPTEIGDFYTGNIWSDGENIYYDDSRVFNKDTQTWEPKTWNLAAGVTDVSGNCIWTDGENIYHSGHVRQYILNKETDTWELTNWRCLFAKGSSIEFEAQDEWSNNYFWSDGENIYYGGDLMLMNSAKSKIVYRSKDGWVDMRGVSAEDAEVTVPILDEIVFDPKNYSQTSPSGYYYKRAVVNPVKTQSLTVTPNLNKQTFSYNYNEQCFFDTITVEAIDFSKMALLCDISIETMPKTEYKVGEWLSTDGGVLLRHYTDGTTKPIDMINYYISGWSKVLEGGAGTYTLICEYKESYEGLKNGIACRTAYDITVTEA